MRTEPVDIYSTEPGKAVVMQNPGRKFPGVLIQGDTLHVLCGLADAACAAMGRASPAFDDANRLRNTLQGMLADYKIVLLEHGMGLPFSEQPRL